MKICYLKLILINYLIYTVQSNWSLRKIFTDNIESDCKRPAKDLSCKNLTSTSEKEVSPKDGSHEYNNEADGLEGMNRAAKIKHGFTKRRRPNNAGTDLIKERIGLGRLSGEIKQTGRNNESYEIILKPDKVRCSNNKNYRLRNKKVKHHRNKHKCRNDVFSDCEDNSCCANYNGDYIYEDDRFSDQVGVGRSADDSEEEDNEFDDGDDGDDGNEKNKVNRNEIRHKSSGLRRTSVPRNKMKRKERLKIFTPLRPDVGRTVELRYCETSTADPLTMEVDPQGINTSPSDSVRVNGSVEGIIVMSFNFSNEDGHDFNSSCRHSVRVCTGVPTEKTYDNELLDPCDHESSTEETELRKLEKSKPDHRSHFRKRNKIKKITLD